LPAASPPAVANDCVGLVSAHYGTYTVKPVVFLEIDPDRKRQLQMQLTAQLPEWFGQPDSNAKYARRAEVLESYVAAVGGDPCGLLLLKRTSPISAEIYWMAVTPARHRQGIGRALVRAASEAARSSGAKYLFVATLHPDDPYEPYARTREFYRSIGFAYVLEEQFAANPNNRLAYYMKELAPDVRGSVDLDRRIPA
jgi:GNAT superfamily N-acetyltransferase